MVNDLHTTSDTVAPPEGLVRRPQSLDISLTGRCNLRCRYCFYSNEMAGLADLPSEQWLAFFRELGNLAVQRVTLSGGEVFCRPDLFALIDGIIDSRMRYGLLTNGTLIDEKTISAFAIGKRRLRLDSIQISIDGSCASIHNKSRPPDSFDRAIRGLQLLQEAGLPVTVRVTVNRHNIDDLENIAALLLDEIGLPSFSTNEAQEMGTARCHGQDVVLTWAERHRAGTILFDLKQRYRDRLNASAGPLAVAEQLADMEERITQGETEMGGRGTLSSCGGVFSKMAVLHDGSMVPCNLLPEMTMGTVGKTPLQETWLHHPFINAMRQRQKISLHSLPGCKDCKFIGFCSGGCPATAKVKFNKLNVIDPATCYRLYQQQGVAA